ncbi:proline iminopeptidase [Penicillium macrosclerotiorum]|uniref:proline iminopeptidase n=1 Tax=Penicillium macrosclerotiorum TaxID=303699 RepID=UPI002546F256|nr:proline iminopeptidase [Penicillium macrosclerotiorum]KAJ5698751.1 proline iminopeptidase [Penicillium macrosclerotiorum]
MGRSSGYSHADAFDQGWLPVDDIHTLHYEQYGSMDGKPVIYLHGGPGDRATKENTKFFNPAVYRVVLFDQRGAGKSIPRGDIRKNTTQHLVADIEKLRSHLKIDKWTMVFGGSWGSTLAVAYAEGHPEAVGSLVLRGVFLGTQQELEWSEEAAANFYPELQEAFWDVLEPEERIDHMSAISAYYKRITSKDKERCVEAARAWNIKELSMSSVDSGPQTFVELEDEDWVLSYARIITHYFAHKNFLTENQLIQNAEAIRHIPTSIVQGRLDLLCPPKFARILHKALPQSKLYMMQSSGHSASETETLEKLIDVCDEYGNL